MNAKTTTRQNHGLSINWIIFLFALLAPQCLFAQTYPFSYGGRIVDPSTGLGYSGAAVFDIKFYDAGTGGTQLGTTFASQPATLQDGVFQIDLGFTGAELKTYFQPGVASTLRRAHFRLCVYTSITSWAS